METEIVPITTNRKARHDYHILETYEAGLQLTGSEVKSLREGRANLKDAYVLIRNGNAVLVGAHISPYSHTGYAGHDPDRNRQLLLHEREIRKIRQKTAEKGLTVVPLRMYFKQGWAKVEIAVAKGKHTYDKREARKNRDLSRDTLREIRKLS
ncbi:MAG: SsrA-binding protein SmpB [Candidatus Neomarinimicrobiota bacterium]|nr:MAG: SsrA-binding protein SmpB [Candidatus Neomarinimicrobiota bacterium]